MEGLIPPLSYPFSLIRRRFTFYGTITDGFLTDELGEGVRTSRPFPSSPTTGQNLSSVRSGSLRLVVLCESRIDLFVLPLVHLEDSESQVVRQGPSHQR